MKIAQLVSGLHPTHPYSNKAINSHVAWLTEGLLSKRHKVNLFAADGSETSAKLHSVSSPLGSIDMSDNLKRYYNLALISKCYEFAVQNKVDVVHSHFNLLSSFFSPIFDFPTLISLHTPISEDIRPLMGLNKNQKYISFSLAQRKQAPELNWYANIYHGVDTGIFSYNEEPEDYLLYLGRITEDKGVHHAIEAAKATGSKLVIAGSSYSKEGYWQKEIEPHINRDNIVYIGEVSFEDKIELFQKAKALLFPTMVSEAFGYSMIEAMSCGTPVIGFGNGSVPEIVKDGQTGFVVDDAEGMIEAIGKIDQIDRKAVRQRAEIYFSKNKMVSGYEKVYKRAIADEAFKKNKTNGKKKVEEDKKD